MLFYLIEKLLWNWVMAPRFFRPRHAFKISMSQSGAMTKGKKKEQNRPAKGIIGF